MKVTILGDGAMGTACAILIASKPMHKVSIWSAFPDQAEQMQAKRENVSFLPGVRIPANVSVTAEIGTAIAGAELVVTAIPTVYLRKTLNTIRRAIPPGGPTVSIIKGIENDSHREYIYDLYDEYDPDPDILSMARTTGYTCSAVADLLISQDFRLPGICPPEYIAHEEINFRFVMEHLRKRNVIYELKIFG